MYPAPFRYFRPDSIDSALNLLSDLGEGARPLAGGQTLIPILKLRMDEPTDLVDISRIPGLRQTDNDNGAVRIGALATHAQIGQSSLNQLVPIIGDCANGIADVQVRSRGTIGGSISTADPSSDWPALLHTLDAEVVCQSVQGSRLVKIKDFITDSYTTVLGNGELVTEIRFNAPGPRSGGSYIGFKKAAPAYPTVAVGIQLTLADDDVCKDVRMVLSAAGPTPVTSDEAESVLRGNSLSKDNLEKAAEAIIAQSDPPTDARGSAAFKCSMLHSLFHKAAKVAINRARGNTIKGGHEYV